MRHLPVFAAALVFIDSLLYAALTPLLPHLLHEFGLSKSGAGILVAAYAVGAFAGGILGGLAATLAGPRRAVLAGLGLMGLSSLGFAVANSFETLFSARLLQGLASGFTWSGAFAWLLAVAPRDRRGQAIGTAMGAATSGAMLGPVVGTISALTGRDVVFSVLAASSLLLVVPALRFESVSAERPSYSAVGRALSNRAFLIGLMLMTLASLLLGILGVLAPLHLAQAGWGAAGIGGLWLTSTAVGTAQAPFIGRMSDRHGALVPTRIALAAGAVMSLALAAGARPLVYAPLVVVAARSYAVLLTTALPLFADGADQVGLAQGMAFGLMNAAWAAGGVAGPAFGGTLASATGDWIPFLLASALCIFSFLAMRRRPSGTIAPASLSSTNE
jgi:MFS family permease